MGLELLDTLLKRRHVIITSVVIGGNGEAELHHAVDSAGEVLGLVEGEAGSEHGGVVEEPDEILDGLVGVVDLGLLAELINDLVLGVELEGLLGDHVAGGGGVTECLGLHDSLHVSGPAVLGGDKDTRRLVDTGAEGNLLDLVAEDVLHELAEGLELGAELLLGLLLVLSVVEVETLLGDGLELVVWSGQVRSS